MSNIVISLGPMEDVQTIIISTKSGREFSTNIIKNNNGYSGEVTAFINSPNYTPPSSLSQLKQNPGDIFEGLLDTVVNYLNQVNDNDLINDIHNTCNTPYIDQYAQNKIVQKIIPNLNVRVN